MKLSEAMLKGIEGTPQAKLGWIEKSTGGRCAIASAMYGAGVVKGPWEENHFCQPTFVDRGVKPMHELNCPIATMFMLFPEVEELWATICTKNMTETREQIAEWLKEKGL